MGTLLGGRDYWMIEAFADMKRDSEKEWYYGNKDKERLGPYSYSVLGGMWFKRVELGLRFTFRG